MTENAEDEGFLKFEEVSAYYIYNFLFDPENWDDINDVFCSGIPNERKGWLPTLIPRSLERNNKYCWFQYSENDFAPSRLRDKQETSITLEPPRGSSGEQLEANISILVRLRKSGIGSLTFRIRASASENNKKINYGKLEPFMRLTSRTWNHKENNVIGENDDDSGEYIWNIKPYLFIWDDITENDNGRFINFLNTLGIDWAKTAQIEKIDDDKTIRVYTEDKILSLKLNDEKTKINLEIEGGKTYEFIVKTENGKLKIYPSIDKKSSPMILSQLFADSLAKLNNIDEDHDYKIKPMRFYAGLFEDESLWGIVEPENSNELENDPNLSCKTDGKDVNKTDTMHPYVCIMGQMGETIYKQTFGDNSDTPMHENLPKYTRQIAALLFRFFKLDQYNEISMDYIKKEFGYDHMKELKLMSHNINSKFFTHVHRMGAVSVHTDNGIPHEMLSRSLIDLLENGRAKWFGLMYANLALDEIIYSVKTISNLSGQNVQELFKPFLVTERLVALSLADSNVYLHDGHVGYDLVDLVHKKMGISILNSLVMGKLDLTDKYIRDVNSVKNYEEIFD